MVIQPRSDYTYRREWLGLVPHETFLRAAVMRDYLPLVKALETNRISEFVAQEEARGIGPIERAEFDGAVAKVLKERRSADQTSRSASGGNSSETETHRGSGPDASR
jgi:hypothetical protein